MFGKKAKTGDRPSATPHPNGDPWDEATLAWLTSSERIGLRITHIERRYKAGPDAPWGRGSHSNPETIASGFVQYAPQHVHLEIEFEEQRDDFGEGFLTYQTNEKYPDGNVNLPVLKLKIYDPHHVIKTGLIEGLRDAIAAGESAAEGRIWAKPAEGRWDGVEGGHSRMIDVTGMISWANTKSPRLQSWALPVGDHDLSTYPDPSQLRLTPKGQQ